MGVVLGIIVAVIGLNVALLLSWCLIRNHRRRMRLKPSDTNTDIEHITGPKSGRASEVINPPPMMEPMGRRDSGANYDHRLITVPRRTDPGPHSPIIPTYLPPNAHPEPPADLEVLGPSSPRDTSRRSFGSGQQDGVTNKQSALTRSFTTESMMENGYKVETGLVDFGEDRRPRNKDKDGSNLNRTNSIGSQSGSSIYSAASAPLERHNSLIRKPVPGYLRNGIAQNNDQSSHGRRDSKMVVANPNPTPSQGPSASSSPRPSRDSSSRPPLPSLPPSAFTNTYPNALSRRTSIVSEAPRQPVIAEEDATMYSSPLPDSMPRSIRPLPIPGAAPHASPQLPRKLPTFPPLSQPQSDAGSTPLKAPPPPVPPLAVNKARRESYDYPAPVTVRFDLPDPPNSAPPTATALDVLPTVPVRSPRRPPPS